MPDNLGRIGVLGMPLLSEAKKIAGWSQQTPGGTVPLLLGGSLGTAVVCFAILTVIAPSDRSCLGDPARCVLAGLGLAALACPLYIVAYLLKGQSAAKTRWERRIPAMAFGAAVLCSVFGLVWVLLAVHAAVRLLAGG